MAPPTTNKCKDRLMRGELRGGLRGGLRGKLGGRLGGKLRPLVLEKG